MRNNRTSIHGLLSGQRPPPFFMTYKNLFLLALLSTVHPVTAQYPKVSQEIAAQAHAARAAANQRSDEAWAKALPLIKEWEAKGKPYIPGAAKPGDLPQAKIPAFPGAWGGGMYSFGGRGGK